MNRVITLCGSLKFINHFVRIQMFLERRGHVVLSVTAGEEKHEPSTMQKEILDKVHYKKILMSDMIIVINVNNYVGNSTRGEIQFAEVMNKAVVYWNESDLVDLAVKIESNDINNI